MVVLPDPDLPISVVMRPAGISSDTSFRTGFTP